MNSRAYRVAVSIGKARPPMSDPTLLKRSGSVRRLVKGLLASARIRASVTIGHFEEDAKRWVEVTIHLLPPSQQSDLFAQGEVDLRGEAGLVQRLQEAGNAAVSRFLEAQRMSIGDLGKLRFEDWCSTQDLEIIKALQSLPGKLVQFDDGNRPFSLGHQGLRGSQVHHKNVVVRCRIEMAGPRRAALVGVRPVDAPADLTFASSVDLLIPRGSDTDRIDGLFATAKSGATVLIAVTPCYRLTTRKVIGLYLAG